MHAESSSRQNPLQRFVSARSLRELLLAALLMTLYVLFARLGIALFSFPPGNQTPVWLASGIGFLLIALFGLRGALAVAVASVLVNAPFMLIYLEQVSMLTIAISIALSVAVDVFQGLFAWSFIRQYEQYHERALFAEAGDLFPFLWRVCFLPSLLTVWMLPLVNNYIGVQPTNVPETLQRTLILTLGDSLGLFVLAPLYWFFRQPDIGRQVRACLVSVSLLSLPLLLSFFVPALPYVLLIPIWIFVLRRQRWCAAVIGTLWLTPLILIMARYQWGLFSFLPQNDAYWVAAIVLFSLGIGGHYVGLMLQELDNAQRKLEQKVHERTEALQQANEKLERLATVDELTQVLNRRAWRERAEAEFSKVRRYPQPLSVLMIDIDLFKPINDQYGHHAGDEVLKQFVLRCQETLRETDIFGRYGGEEFVLLMPRATLTDALALAERLRLAIAEREFRVLGIPLKISASIGVAEKREHEHSLDLLLRRADLALYQAKADGRNRVASQIEQSPQ
ncbi:sensor domain-containing diguanylate cyclase [Permianibacter aggregans]|uniref:diguanylate cyclase n=1 Tax=Permianibacter aggregans TaxID=1510150 RepID=A0A4R6UR23_9GAMM|nr:diguanylate cyclase [Permianibacter aggregans]QGX39517.1 sensor domain-containing diguanylate cyclase [Permianibacter aggregans]TDQ49738.1 diguanylate cyclase (GGDEF)-like protein [Permianibacter aggregans]